jgi:group I intron endonuclease
LSRNLGILWREAEPPHPEKCIERENYYFKLLKPAYNIFKVAGSNLGYKHTEENLAKMRVAKLGIRISEEHKAKLRAANVGRKHSGATKAKQSAVMKGKTNTYNLSQRKEIIVTDVTTNITTSYISIHEAAAALNIRIQAISNYINRNQKTPYKGKYIFLNQ